jgi:diguanylate cyclase (GGDEF)-like protein
MAFIAAAIYWVIVALWLTVLLSVVYFYVRNPRAFGTTRLLLAVIGVDTLRNVMENVYFGTYFGARYGFFPDAVAEMLGMPELLILPKVANIIAGVVVLSLLLFRWLPNSVREWKQTQERTHDLETLAAIDPLTGAYNRRQFDKLASAEIGRAQRHKRPLSILMIDIDYFKRINDRFGHELGDWVLKMVVTSISSAKRESDILARLGGEEFALLLPETALTTAGAFADRLRQTIHRHALRIGEDRLALTVSIGVADADENTASIDPILRKADKALYDAKRSGRDRVVVATPQFLSATLPSPKVSEASLT